MRTARSAQILLVALTTLLACSALAEDTAQLLHDRIEQLRENPDFAPHGLRSAAASRSPVAGGKTTIVTLSPPVPVLLTYWTAWVDRAGTLQLRKDVYGRDARVAEGLDAEFRLRPRAPAAQSARR